MQRVASARLTSISLWWCGALALAGLRPRLESHEGVSLPSRAGLLRCASSHRPSRRLAPDGLPSLTQPSQADVAGRHHFGLVVYGGWVCRIDPRYHAVLAVKVCALAGRALAPCGRLRTLTACAAPWCSGLGQSRPIRTGVRHVVVVSVLCRIASCRCTAGA